jgi:predicted amidohydrolase
MKIAFIQSSLIWENSAENRSYFDEKINQISQDIDLIILPEMFTTGFTMDPKPVAETMNGITIKWLQTIASEKKCAITGSLVITENNHFYNRLVFIFPDGKIDFYDKKHLFTLANEHKKYTAGKQKKVIDYNGFRICPLICYDLRFPVFARNDVSYDLLIYVANWPKVRINAWNALLKARAIENMSYVIGVNRIGTDKNDLHYNGQSQVIDFMGVNVIAPQEIEGVFITSLNKNQQDEARTKLNFLNDKDDFVLV